MTLDFVKDKIAEIVKLNATSQQHAFNELQLDYLDWISLGDAVYTSPTEVKSIAQLLSKTVGELTQDFKDR